MTSPDQQSSHGTPAATAEASIGRRAYLQAIGLFLLIYVAGFVVVNVVLPERPAPAYPLAGLAVLVVGVAAGGRWQGLRGARQWGTYVVAAIIAWIVAAAILATTVVVGTLLLAEAAEDTGAVPGPDGRIERPEDGFAIAFPGGWSAEVLDEWMPVGGDRGDAKMRLALMGWRGSSEEESCAVTDLTRVAASWPRWTSLDDGVGWAAAWASEQETTVDAPVEVDLPAGLATYVDVHYASGWEMRDIVLRDGVRWFLLQCGGEDPPDDRWRSIAETFEFLPSEE